MASVRSRKSKDGRRYQVRWQGGSKTFSQSSAAKKFKTQVELREQLGPLYQEPSVRFGDFSKDWLKRYGQGRAPSTYRTATEDLRSLEALNESYLDQLTVSLVEDHLAELASRAPRMAQKAQARLKMILNAAKSRGQVVDEAVLTMPNVRHRAKAPKFLTWDEVCALESWLPEHIKRIVPFAVLTGLRFGELSSLRESDVDWEQGTLRVAGTKTAASRRTVELAPLALNLLREQLLARPMEASDEQGRRDLQSTGGGDPRRGQGSAGRLPDGQGRSSDAGGARRGTEETVREDRGASGRAGQTLLFTSPTGKTLNRNSFESRHFRPAARAAGLASPERSGVKVPYDGPSFHSTRHSFASLLVAANVHPRVAAALMGHADNGGLFLKLYGHLYSAAASEAVLALDRVVRRASDATKEEAM